MTGGLARNLERSLTISIAIALVILTAAASMVLYVVRIRSITQDGSYVFHETIQVAATAHPHEALSVAEKIATHLYHPGLEVVLTHGTYAYAVRWQNGASGNGLVQRIGSDPQQLVPFSLRNMPFDERISFYLARMSGYAGSATRVGGIGILVQADRALLIGVARQFVATLVGGVLLWLLLANFAARRLTERALRPLGMVLKALEASAAGDLESRVTAPKRNDELGRLCAAYNCTIETVSHALTQQGRSERRMRQFIADAGHQLQTPLTVMRGYISILRRGELRTQDDIPRILEKMERQSTLMAALIQKLMLLQAWEGEDRTKVDPIDVGALVAQTVGSIADANPERVLQIDATENTWVRVASDELTYAISNLVDNALKYGRERPVTVTVTPIDGCVHIIVADQGDGMTEEESARVFDRFYRGSRRDVPGSGLGLAIARRAVERAQGTLTVASAPGAGSTFTIVLPALAPVAVAPVADSTATNVRMFQLHASSRRARFRNYARESRHKPDTTTQA